jgi:hypothetical protein
MKCEYCSSGIKKVDKVCSRCGAPNEEYDEHDNKHRDRSQSFGEFIKQIENTEPASWHDESFLEKYLINPLENYANKKDFILEEIS